MMSVLKVRHVNVMLKYSFHFHKVKNKRAKKKKPHKVVVMELTAKVFAFFLLKARRFFEVETIFRGNKN